MPLTRVRTFRVRHYECDAYGHVNNVNYLRYMQEAAFDASAAAGYDLARYAEMGFHWLVRDSDIEYLRPARYADSVIVRTWVADFRRVRSRRAYEFRVAASGGLAARAHTDWVLVDSATGAPAPIPPEMISAFFPEGQPEQATPRERFPAAPPALPGEFRIRRLVRWQDIDPARHDHLIHQLAVGLPRLPAIELGPRQPQGVADLRHTQIWVPRLRPLDDGQQLGLLCGTAPLVGF